MYEETVIEVTTKSVYKKDEICYCIISTQNKEKIAYKIADNVTVLLELNCRSMVRIGCMERNKEIFKWNRENLGIYLLI